MSDETADVIVPLDVPAHVEGDGGADADSGAGDPRDAVRAAVRAAAALGVPGIVAPGLDESGMAAIWTAMIVSIARRCRVELTATTAAKIAMSALAGVAAYSLGSKILTVVLALLVPVLPMAALPAAMGMNAALNAVFTYKLGTECIERFSEAGISGKDVLMTGWRLAPVLSLSEIGDLRRLLSGA